MHIPRFPVEYQMDSQDCGPASLKIIAKHFGKFYSLQFLRDRCGITKEGVSLLDLSSGALINKLRSIDTDNTMEYNLKLF
jgi:ATP-binding cassette subfamily B protein